MASKKIKKTRWWEKVINSISIPSRRETFNKSTSWDAGRYSESGGVDRGFVGSHNEELRDTHAEILFRSVTRRDNMSRPEGSTDDGGGNNVYEEALSQQ